jgi:YedE family putative selenium metabolism protein
VGIAGLVAGIAVGVQFLKMGFSLGRSYPSRALTGLVMPFLMAALMLLAVAYPHLGPEGKAALFRSSRGPGAQAAPVVISILFGLAVGFLAQRTRFCTVGALRDVILMRDFHLLSGVAAFAIAAFVMNLVYGQFHPGFVLSTSAEGAVVKQPASHTVHWLNFSGMALAGLAFTLAGGCPGRQLFLSGEGDGDAAVFVLGMLAGAGVAHNFAMAGAQPLAPYMVVVGLILVLLVGIAGREKLVPVR